MAKQNGIKNKKKGQSIQQKQKQKQQSTGQPKKKGLSGSGRQHSSKGGQEPPLEEWVAALATRASSASSDVQQYQQQQVQPSTLTSIQRRLEKKQRRNDRMLARAREREARAAKMNAAKRRQKRQLGLRGDDESVEDHDGGRRQSRKRIVRKNIQEGSSTSTSTSSSALSTLSAVVEKTTVGWDKGRPPRPYVDPANGTKGKATKRNKYETSNIQPRDRDYGGLGLARPSLYLQLLDPSFIPKFREDFIEHIPGFFGKQRTKAMKKQLDGGMLWRRLAEKKRGPGGAGGNRGTSSDDWQEVRVGGKKLKDMKPDERVEAMIKLDMI